MHQSISSRWKCARRLIACTPVLSMKRQLKDKNCDSQSMHFKRLINSLSYSLVGKLCRSCDSLSQNSDNYWFSRLVKSTAEKCKRRVLRNGVEGRWHKKKVIVWFAESKIEILKLQFMRTRSEKIVERRCKNVSKSLKFSNFNANRDRWAEWCDASDVMAHWRHWKTLSAVD